MAKKSGEKVNLEMPGEVKFVYWYHLVRFVLFVIMGLIVVFVGSAASFVLPLGLVSKYLSIFLVVFVLLLVLYWKFLIRNFKKGSRVSYWASVGVSIYFVISSLASLPEFNLFLPFEIAVIVCLFLKNSKNFFGRI